MLVQRPLIYATCDYCERYIAIEHAGLARSARGEWCEVLWFCQDCTDKQVATGWTVKTRKQAEKVVSEIDPNDTVEWK